MEAATPPVAPPAADYPARFDVEYPERLSHWKVLVKWLLALPHLISLTFLAVAAWVVLMIAWFAILFTGRYPRGMFDFVVGTLRWWIRVQAYAHWLMTDRYPPFSLK